ncbi:MAG: sugar ABC transporter ATP-binding protein [Acidimicrobiales bacterium]
MSKSYGASPVLSGVTLGVDGAEIVGLLGPNGAGKTTLIKVIGGALPPDHGNMQLDGQAIDLANYSPRMAQALGVSSVQQELSLCTNLSVAENFFLTQPVRSRKWRRACEVTAKRALEDVFPNSGISVSAKVSTLTLAQRQMVEIARGAAAPHLKLLVLDEPTSALSQDRIGDLHNYLRLVRQRGIGIIYVSHKLDEVLAIVDRVTILRGGENHWAGQVEGLAHDDLLSLLGGKATVRSNVALTSDQVDRQPVLKCEHMKTPRLNDIDLVVHRGEIVGLAGLAGAGQRALLHEIFRPSRTTRRALSSRGTIAYVTGDRQAEGLFYLWGISRNIIVTALSRLSPRGLVIRSKADDLAQRWMTQLKLKSGSSIASLSGGNQQRVLLARGLAAEADLLLFDDPMRGVDAGTKSEFYSLLDGLRGSESSVMWYSTEDAEFQCCDRVYVMRGGTISKELIGDSISTDNIVHWSFPEEKLLMEAREI